MVLVRYLISPLSSQEASPLNCSHKLGEPDGVGVGEGVDGVSFGVGFGLGDGDGEKLAEIDGVGDKETLKLPELFLAK